MTAVLDVSAARARALFASTIQQSSRATAQEIRRTVQTVVRSRGCREVAASVAQEFGDHPETAATRMAWARYTVAVTWPRRHQHTKRYPWCQACQYTPERVAQIHAEVREAKKVAAGEPSAPLLTAAEVIALLGLDGTDQS